MSKQATKALIDANITANGAQAITGPILNNVLNTMVDDYGTQDEVSQLAQEVNGMVKEEYAYDFSISDKDGNRIVVFKNGELQTKKFDSSFLKVQDANADLSIMDKNNFAIVEFSGGHIKTKYFDSRNINPLTGKKVAFLGDSITQGFYASPRETKRYSTIFCGLGGCTEINLGVAATCIANNTLNGMSSQRFITRATSANLQDTDLIFVFGGTNDFSYDSKAIGPLFYEAPITPDTCIGDYKKIAPNDTDTFAGALHELILQIRQVAPSAQLVFITPLSRGRYSAGRPTSAECNQHGDYLQDFINAIKEICAFYQIPVVDMGAMMNQDWQNDTTGSLQSYDYDGLHPNTAGHERLGKLLYKWTINNLIF